ncbi:MAG: PQQ-dependent sugar dehydrogenase [Bacteroidota bacterium]
MNIKLLPLALIAATMCAVSAVYAQPVAVGVKLVTDGLQYPTGFAQPNDKTGRLFVAEQRGTLRIIQNGKLLAQPFLDFHEDVYMTASADERGLLGFTFHPDFAKNKKLYVYFSKRKRNVPGVDHEGILREYKVSATNANQVDKASGRDVMSIDEPESNHNGGDIKFGPDGYLYLGLGDGGAYNDLHGEIGNGQNLNTPLGKILRIDVNQQPYGIPADNPFAGQENKRPEIFAYGLRNPWRLSFDKLNGRLFVGDVGQKNWEEIDIVTKGGNYGWRVREGIHSKTPTDPDPKNWINPIIDYGREEGLSVTGGYVYRGKAIPALAGKYVFGDLSGKIWALTDVKKEFWVKDKLSISKDPGYWLVYSFGEDQAGELYILAVLMDGLKGSVFKIVK